MGNSKACDRCKEVFGRDYVEFDFEVGKFEKCGCGGDYLFDRTGRQYHVQCKKCGISTPMFDDPDEARKCWNNAMKYRRKWDTHKCPSTNEYDDHVCLGCSGNFGKEEYY